MLKEFSTALGCLAGQSWGRRPCYRSGQRLVSTSMGFVTCDFIVQELVTLNHEPPLFHLKSGGERGDIEE